MMGGSMYRKNVSGVSGDTWTLLAWNSRTPTITPTVISKQDSGKILLNFGAMWKPERRTSCRIKCHIFVTSGKTAIENQILRVPNSDAAKTWEWSPAVFTASEIELIKGSRSRSSWKWLRPICDALPRQRFQVQHVAWVLRSFLYSTRFVVTRSRAAASCYIRYLPFENVSDILYRLPDENKKK